ncbi:MAG TPA: glycosyltransferase family A protein [Xanthomonadales bacterium]|nr:glycosyltransferase family A protein [Xanthomonadales bacterium]
MNPRHPTISAIIPVYNGGRFIAQALDSVFGQAHRPLEIIIVDDGSTDSSAGIIRDSIERLDENITFVAQANKGPAAARNRGLDLARGEFIAFLDADDLWAEGMLQGQLQWLLQDDSHQLVVGCTQRVRQESNGLEAFGPRWMAFLLGAGLFRRPVFDTVGLFDESLRFGEDVDWFFRARELAVPMGISNATTLLYRSHEHNMTRDTARSDGHFLLALKKSLDRRRQEDGKAADLPAIAALENLALEESGLDKNETTHEPRKPDRNLK